MTKYWANSTWRLELIAVGESSLWFLHRQSFVFFCCLNLTQAFGLPLAYPKATALLEDITTVAAKANAFRENSKGILERLWKK